MTRIFRGFAADGSKLYADRCTYCLREGHRASHCPSRKPADFAELAESCEQCGLTFRTGCRCHERDAGEGFGLANAELWRTVQRIGAAAGLGLLVFLIAKAMGAA